MRQILLLFLLTFPAVVFAQRLAENKLNIHARPKNDTTSTAILCTAYNIERNPLTPASFNKMMRNDFLFTIVGSKTPVSGFKIETSSPSVTFSGNALTNKNRTFIMNLQLTASTSNNISEIFSQQKLNGTFSGSLGFNFMIPKFQKGIYNISDDNKKIKHFVISQYALSLSKSFFETLTYTVISDTGFKNINTFDDFTTKIINIAQVYVDRHSACTIDGDSITATALKVLKKYLPANNDDNNKIFQSFQRNYFAGNLQSIDLLDKKLSEARGLTDVSKNVHMLPDKINDSCIAIFKDIWVRKRLMWLNITPTVSNGSLTFYDTIKKKTADTTSLQYGVQLALNLLIKYAQTYRYIYGKFGGDLGQANNVGDLKKISYLNSNTLTSTSTSALTSQKTGTAYKGQLANSFSWDVFFEFYMAVIKSPAAPGLYLRPVFSHVDQRLNKNRLSGDLGLIWNLASSDKTKNLVSIVPYVSWANFLNDYTDQTKTTKNSLADLFSIGVKFGIPINLGN